MHANIILYHPTSHIHDNIRDGNTDIFPLRFPGGPAQEILITRNEHVNYQNKYRNRGNNHHELIQ